MTIKQQGGVFGRNPAFNDVEAGSLKADTVDINGGTIDGTVIGGSTPAAISGTTGTFSNGNVSINNGNLVIGTAGKGIDFSATSGTGTSELFDDYEEGTWTPTLDAGASGLGGTPITAGAYVKIGDLVHVKFYYANTWTTTGAAFLIGGLPFTPSTSGNSWSAIGSVGGSGVTINGSSTAILHAQIPLGGAEQYKIKAVAQDNTLGYLLTATTSKGIEGTITYRAA